ncbi:uncharacterized protein BcabD6B2_03420 [Babesia caballi]|uniref:Uncharacterized protein n=1 Tax=Babesia caballi TaxID=5871 RepID=A0AAV4LLD1_BABCB|nr:hypothetical protein, conserved [Babesia caballi]
MAGRGGQVRAGGHPPAAYREQERPGGREGRGPRRDPGVQPAARAAAPRDIGQDGGERGGRVRVARAAAARGQAGAAAERAGAGGSAHIAKRPRQRWAVGLGAERRAGVLGSIPGSDKHEEQKLRELARGDGLDFVLADQHALERPRVDVVDLALLVVEAGARLDHGARNGAQELDDQLQVVQVALLAAAAVRVKEVVAGDELEDDARQRPEVGRLVVTDAQDGLGTPVLPSLDLVGEVLADPAGVAEVANLEDGVGAALLRADVDGTLAHAGDGGTVANELGDAGVVQGGVDGLDLRVAQRLGDLVGDVVVGAPEEGVLQSVGVVVAGEAAGVAEAGPNGVLDVGDVAETGPGSGGESLRELVAGQREAASLPVLALGAEPRARDDLVPHLPQQRHLVPHGLSVVLRAALELYGDEAGRLRVEVGSQPDGGEVAPAKLGLNAIAPLVDLAHLDGVVAADDVGVTLLALADGAVVALAGGGVIAVVRVGTAAFVVGAGRRNGGAAVVIGNHIRIAGGNGRAGGAVGNGIFAIGGLDTGRGKQGVAVGMADESVEGRVLVKIVSSMRFWEI